LEASCDGEPAEIVYPDRACAIALDIVRLAELGLAALLGEIARVARPDGRGAVLSALDRSSRCAVMLA